MGAFTYAQVASGQDSSEETEANSAESAFADVAREPATEAVDPEHTASARDQLIEEWNRPGRSLEGRITSTRSTLVDLGMVGFPSAARLLIRDETLGKAVTRAKGAVSLAPELPDAHAFQAKVMFDEKKPIGFLRAATAGLFATRNHLEGGHWFGGHLWAWLALSLGAGGGLFLLVAGATAIPRTAILFAGPSRTLPLPSGVALLLTLVLVPAGLGLGLFGVLLALGLVALVAGSSSQRISVALAFAALIYGGIPALDRSAEILSRPGSDPVAEAAYSTDWETASLLDLSRLRGASDDPLARRGLATWEHRRGLDSQALARYEGLLGAQADAGALNNAAVLRLAVGDSEGAIALFERAAKQSRSAAVLVNLSEAYGRSIRLDEQNLAMAEAQLLDPHAVKELTRSGKSTVLRDMGITADAVNARLREAPHIQSADFLRRGWVPAWVGQRWIFLLALTVGIALLASACSRWLPERHTLSERLDLRLQQGATTDPFERVREVAQARERKLRLRWSALFFAGCVPGAAGVIARRPMAGLIACLASVAGASAWWMRDGLFADPLSSGLLWYGTASTLATVAFVSLAWTTFWPLLRIWRD